jgi:hypothetical protein
MSGSASRDENAGADDRADPQARELHGAKDPTKPVLALHLRQEYLERFSCKQLIRH